MNVLGMVLLLLISLLLAVFPAMAQQTSEEFPPVICNPHTFIGSMGCMGSYCDNVSIACRQAPGAVWGPQALFAQYVSEEHGGYRACPPGFAIAGVACRGSYCDDISLLCVQVNGRRLGNCSETVWFSEEGYGSISLNYDLVATGMICAGQYCDNKKLIYCQLIN